jgi:hypothetical protein
VPSFTPSPRPTSPPPSTKLSEYCNRHSRRRSRLAGCCDGVLVRTVATSSATVICTSSTASRGALRIAGHKLIDRCHNHAVQGR